MEKTTNGYLELILGPMFSGKTSKLIEIYKQYRFCDIHVLAINHSDDTRHTSFTMTSHDQHFINCIQSETIEKIIDTNMELLASAKPMVILINEGQFFPDLCYGVSELVNKYNAHVYVAGLDGDFKREKFGQMLDLIPICDKVYKLHSLCVLCKNGTKAIFSHRILKSCTEQKQIGASDSYLPLCRECFKKSTFIEI
jgi:thymidine kinase